MNNLRWCNSNTHTWHYITSLHLEDSSYGSFKTSFTIESFTRNFCQVSFLVFVTLKSFTRNFYRVPSLVLEAYEGTVSDRGTGREKSECGGGVLAFLPVCRAVAKPSVVRVSRSQHESPQGTPSIQDSAWSKCGPAQHTAPPKPPLAPFSIQHTKLTGQIILIKMNKNK